MDYHELTQAEYEEALRQVISPTESLHTMAQDIGDNRATIGWGYTFNRANNVEIWQRSGIVLTDREIDVLRQIDEAPARDRTRIGLTFPRQLSEAEANSLLTASLAEYESPAIDAEMPLSRERVAVVSITYNRGVQAVSGSGLMEAIETGNRAESWYEMRYNSWGSNPEYEGGLRKRRGMEAQVFGLYDDPASITGDDALATYEMFQQHRSDIVRLEESWGVSIEGVESRRNIVAAANRDYADLTQTYGTVPTINDALSPARDKLLQDLRLLHPELADHLTEKAFNAAAIHIDAENGTVRIDEPATRQNPRGRPEHPDHPDHPDHPMLEQIRAGMRIHDERVGKSYDDASERISHCLLAACKDNRDMYPGTRNVSLANNALTRVDHVVMGEKGNIFAVEGNLGDPAHKRVFVNAEQAMQTSIEQSDQKLATANQHIARELELARQHERANTMNGPGRDGPTVAV